MKKIRREPLRALPDGLHFHIIHTGTYIRYFSNGICICISIINSISISKVFPHGAMYPFFPIAVPGKRNGFRKLPALQIPLVTTENALLPVSRLRRALKVFPHPVWGRFWGPKWTCYDTGDSGNINQCRQSGQFGNDRKINKQFIMRL